MKGIELTAVDLAERFLGVHETPGPGTSPAVLWFLQSCDESVTDDSVAWCSGFANRIAWLLNLPRSRSLAARSWLKVGTPVEPFRNALRGFDVVIIKQQPQDPGPEVLQFRGHVGWFVNFSGDNVIVRGGNQGDRVSDAAFPVSRILGVRRVFE